MESSLTERGGEFYDYHFNGSGREQKALVRAASFSIRRVEAVQKLQEKHFARKKADGVGLFLCWKCFAKI